MNLGLPPSTLYSHLEAPLPPSIIGTATGAYTTAGAPGPDPVAYYAHLINAAASTGELAVHTLATNLHANSNKMYKDGVAMAQNVAQAAAHINHLQRENETLKAEGRGLLEAANTIIDLVKQDCGACLTVLRTSLANAPLTTGNPLNSATQTSRSLVQRIMGITPAAAMRSVPRSRSVTTVPTVAGGAGGGGVLLLLLPLCLLCLLCLLPLGALLAAAVLAVVVVSSVQNRWRVVGDVVAERERIDADAN